MATPGEELLGEHYGRDHLTYEEIGELNLKVVPEAGEGVPEDELRGKVFRFEEREDEREHPEGRFFSEGHTDR